MANLTLKDVPDQIHADLKIAARSAGKSLNTYIISLLELSTDERWRRRTMREQCCENNAARTTGAVPQILGNATSNDG